MARMPLYLGERLGLVAMVVVSREARKASDKERSAAYTAMHKTTVDTHQAVHCWWIFLHVYLVKVVVLQVHLCVKYKVKINSKMQKFGDFNMRVKRRR